MKFETTAIAALLPALSLAHYTFPKLTVNGKTSGEWEFIRRTENKYSNGPVENANSPLMRCYEEAGRPPAATADVAAGSPITFQASNSMGHPGPFTMYMAKVPAGSTAATWDGSGPVWFKIMEEGATGSAKQGNGGSIFNTSKNSISATIPKSVPSGEYLVRAEHIGLHIQGKPQWYIACAQVKVSGGGSGSPGPKVAFPGAYRASDPGLAYQLYGNNAGPYKVPGPAVWSG